MKFSLSTAVAALSFVSVMAAPVVEKSEVAAAKDARDFSISSSFSASSYWWIGTAKPYKIKAYRYLQTFPI
jgi:hypothetical protein